MKEVKESTDLRCLSTLDTRHPNPSRGLHSPARPLMSLVFLGIKYRTNKATFHNSSDPAQPLIGGSQFRSGFRLWLGLGSGRVGTPVLKPSGENEIEFELKWLELK